MIFSIDLRNGDFKQLLGLITEYIGFLRIDVPEFYWELTETRTRKEVQTWDAKAMTKEPRWIQKGSQHPDKFKTSETK